MAGAVPPASATGVSPALLWSTNTYLKYLIQKTYRADKHYVWCSSVLEGAAMPKYAIGAGQPPSSDPASIYRTLHHAVRTSDAGDQKIAEQKKLSEHWL